MNLFLTLAPLLVLLGPLLALAAPSGTAPNLLASTGISSKRQAPPNTVYTRFPNSESTSLNLTFFAVPAPLALAKQIAGKEFALLPSFREHLPADVSATIGEGEHPLFVLAYYSTDVHYGTAPFVIDAVSVVQTYAGFVDCTGDGKTACYRQYAGYFDQLFPALAGNALAATRLLAGSFKPPHSPYGPVGAGRYGINVTDVVGGLFGAGRPYTSSWAFDTSAGAGLTGEVVQEWLQGPLVRSLDQGCTKSIYFFNETTPVRHIVADINVRSPLLPCKGLAGQQLDLKDVLGFAVPVQRAANIPPVNCTMYANGA
ncbi:unnamed protein product [Tilletia laevis]|uniref:Uncharacterized protein n=2 Tax=Tilletia TaxID=13289 RepID=A0A8X7SUF8_9BASI|nr:hypothetical protein CF328_g7796 [Tilletia controversa]KAE8185765.1 hypothetical protein CF335_g7634 [Tilletia laevis]KAE8252573.1 hypothetical protein A4X03_0g6126 [Tilletia caries]KAE8242096.1 hypothetical protein A4X06_0g7241 [Tilletia controversa]CAD6884058.1 unnamed protein product [Tilletia caries]